MQALFYVFPQHMQKIAAGFRGDPFVKEALKVFFDLIQIDAANRTAISKVAASAVIANPHPEVMRQIETSRNRHGYTF